VIRDSAFIGGARVKAFEEEFAAFSGARFAVGVSNGTDALRLALLACGICPGDEVITVPNTFIATAEAISMTGASVRFVDVRPDTSNLDHELLPGALSARTRCIVPVHLYGRPADMDPILDFAGRHGLKVIGDAAQAHGAEYRGRKVGALGDAACFSFYPGKNLGADGDAGAVVTGDPAIAEKVAVLRDHGRLAKYEHQVEGFNARLDGLQAAVLSVKLRRLEAWTERRREIARRYGRELGEIEGLTLPSDPDGARAVYHLYVVRSARRDALQASLQAAGVSTAIHYPIPLHLQPAYSRLRLGRGSFPAAERLASEILSLPMYPELRDDQLARVVEQVRGFFRSSP
jgi:dTDP-4-amino-4,6-dideoxygalactose transaminase